MYFGVLTTKNASVDVIKAFEQKGTKKVSDVIVNKEASGHLLYTRKT